MATYTYNYLGQRTRKVTPRGTVVYHYDLEGNRISETTGAGVLIRDQIRMALIPVAKVPRSTPS